jgi:O-antigen biosynthesis protein WbqP
MAIKLKIMMSRKRFFDISIIIVFFPIWMPIYFLVYSIVIVSSGFPAVYWSKRVGKDGTIFFMPKFRTMRLDTPNVATNLLENPRKHLTPLGGGIRKTSLDELPQLISILRGQMSIVGPRPALFNQENLIQLRSSAGVNILSPGLTGWAQVNGRDNISEEQKVAFDYEYLQNQSLLFDMKIIWLTVLKVIKSDGVIH